MSWQDIVGIIVAIIAFAALIYLMIKKHDARLVLLFIGFIMLLIAGFIGRLSPVNWYDQGSNNFKPDYGTGVGEINAFYVIALEFKNYFVSAGLIIMALFGYTKFMSEIGANGVIVNLLTKPLLKIKHKYLLLFMIFILGNILSIVVPSASSLAVILMTLLFPILKKAKISTLSSVAIIATTATIFPTPLGSDSAFVSTRMNWDLIGYTYARLAIVAIPSLILMGIAHLFWQKFMDKKFEQKNNILGLVVEQEVTFETKTEQQNLPPSWYSILPILPIFVLLIPFIVNLVDPNIGFKFGIVETIILCTIVTIVIQMIRQRQVKPVLNEFTGFFKGMGDGFASVVVLSTAASIFSKGLISLGVIKLLTDSVNNISGAAYGYLFIFALIILLIGSLSGSGTSTVFAFVPIVASISETGGLTGSEQLMVVIPIQELANLSRSFSPIAAVIIICAQQAKVETSAILKRIALPAGVAVVSVIILSIVFYGLIGLQPIGHGIGAPTMPA